MKNEAWLQFWHAELNRMFFDGKLEPALVRIVEADHTDSYDNPIMGQFMHQCDPYLIVFWYDPSKESDIDTLSVLLHEMIHQYCAENDIEDMEDGEHNSAFMLEAKQHGLAIGGCILSDEASKTIRERLTLVNMVCSFMLNEI